jgi:hypothetical protein
MMALKKETPRVGISRRFSKSGVISTEQAFPAQSSTKLPEIQFPCCGPRTERTRFGKSPAAGTLNQGATPVGSQDSPGLFPPRPDLSWKTRVQVARVWSQKKRDSDQGKKSGFRKGFCADIEA